MSSLKHLLPQQEGRIHILYDNNITKECQGNSLEAFSYLNNINGLTDKAINRNICLLGY